VLQVARSNVVSSLFYGVSAEVIAEWCAVSVKTAKRWKRGESPPTASAMKLFRLHRDRQVLGAEWDGWLINGGTIVDPDGNETTQEQLRAYVFVYQLCRELAREDPQALQTLQRLTAKRA
jgi:hypothetical protein